MESDSESVLDLVEEPFTRRLMNIRRLERLSQVLQQVALLRSEIGRSNHPRRDDLIATRAPAQVWHAFVSQPELLARLRSMRNLQRDLAIHRRNLDFGTQCGLSDVDRQVQVDLFPVTHEEIMRLDTNANVEVPGRTSWRLLTLT